MISQNRGGLPIFLADLGVAVKTASRATASTASQPGDVMIMNHGERLRPAPQQRRDLCALLPRRRARRLRRQPRPLGRYRRHAQSASARSRPTEIYAEGLQLRSLKIYEAGKRNETLWQIIRDNHALSRCRARRPARADRLLPARRRAATASCSRATAATTVEACIARGLGRRPSARRAPSWRKFPTAPTRPRASSTTTAARSTCRCASRSRCVIARLPQMTIDFSEMQPRRCRARLNSGRSGGHRRRARRVQGAHLARPRRERGLLPAARASILPEGTILNARPPAALGLWSIALPTVIDTILKALAPALPIASRPRTRATWAAARSSASAPTARASC